MKTPSNAFYWVFGLVAPGLIPWGLIQRFRGSAPTAGDSPEARTADRAESLPAFWWLGSP